MSDLSIFDLEALYKIRPLTESHEPTEFEKERMLCEHLYPGHRYPEGGNLESSGENGEFRPSPSIAVIKNDSGVDTGSAINDEKKNVVLAHRFTGPDGKLEIGICSHWRRGNNGHEDWTNLTPKQIAHLARHAGLTVSGDEE